MVRRHQIMRRHTLSPRRQPKTWVVAEVATTVAPFSERLLRVLPPLIVTAVRDLGSSREDDTVTEDVTTVTPFSENLLRVLLPLRADLADAH